MTTETPEQTDEAVEGTVSHHPGPEPDIEGLSGERPTELVTLRSKSGKGALSIDPNQAEWSPTQIAALQSIGIQTEGDDAVPMAYVLQFLHNCQKADLDPWMREAYLITHGKRFTDNKGKVVDKRKFTLVTGIDGFRKKAEDTGEYAGQVGPQWCGEDGVWKEFWNKKWGPPVAARVGILRHGFPEPVWGVAVYDEFVPMVDEWREVEKQGQYGPYMKSEKTGEKKPTEMWQKMPANQLAKCSEAQGHRKAFPRTMAGLYEAAEMQRAQADYAQQQRDEVEKAQTRARVDAYNAAKAVTSGAERAVAEPMGQGPQAEPEPVRVGDVAGEVVQEMRGSSGDPGDSDAWRAELEFQASVLGVKPETVTKRDAAIIGKPYQQWDADESAKVVVKLRLPVSARLRTTDDDTRERNGWPTPEAYAATPQDAPYVEHADGEVVPDTADGGSDDQDDGEVPQGQKHDYEDQGGLCAVPWCGEEADNVIHNEVPR